MNQEHTNSLATGSIGKLIAKFAIPSITAMLINAIYNILDQVFIGQGIGYLGNGAANVVLLITLVTLSFSLLLGDGAAASFSLSLGKQDPSKAKESVGTAIISITVVSIIIMILGLCFLEPIIRLFGGTDILMPYAKEYGFYIVLGLPFMMISTTINAIIRADGSPRYAMAAMIIGALINGCLDPVFIFVLDLGIAGPAMTTLIGQMITFGISIAYLRKFKSIDLAVSQYRMKFTVLRQICALGISSFIDQLAFTIVMTVNNNLIVKYGAGSVYGSEIPLTAYGIAMKVQEILFTVLLGLAIGTQPIIGFNYGAKNYQRVRKTFYYAVCIGTLISLGAVILFIGFPDIIINIFGSADQSLYIAFSKHFFQTYFLVYIFFGFQTISGVFFQAIGKPKEAAIISLSYQLIFKIGSAIILSMMIGLDGVLWSGPVADTLIVIMVTYFVYKEMKIMKIKSPSS